MCLLTFPRDVKTDFTWEDFLFGTITLTKHAKPNKYGYCGYGIRFDKNSQFSFSNDEVGNNVIFFGVKISS